MSCRLRTPRPPGAVLDRFHQAMRDKSADDLADLYAPDAVHEFPFTSPGFPPRYAGREEVRAGYRAVWGAMSVRVTAITGVTVHETGDPEVIIAEQIAVVTAESADGASGDAVAAIEVPGLLILRVRDGLIIRVRDYMDGLGVVRRLRPQAGAEESGGAREA